MKPEQKAEGNLLSALSVFGGKALLWGMPQAAPARVRKPIGEAEEFEKLLGIPEEKRLLTPMPLGVPIEWPTKERSR